MSRKTCCGMCVVVLGVGCLLLPLSAADEDKPYLLSVKEIKVAEADDELVKLQKQRYNAAARDLQARMALYNTGESTLDPLFAAGRRILRADLALAGDLDKKVQAHARMLELAKFLEERASVQFGSGVTTVADLELARYHRIDAEIGLLKAKRAAKLAASRVDGL